MRKSFRGAVAFASLAMLVGPATLLAQYPIVQDGQIVYPQVPTPIYQPAIIQPPVQQPAQRQPQQSIAQPTQQPAPKPPAAKPVDDKAIEKAWLEKVIAERLEAAIAKQAEQIKAETEKAKPVDPPKPVGHPAPVGVFLDHDRTSFESSIEEQAREYQTNGIDASKIPTQPRITHGGQDLSAQQFASELRDHYGAGPFDNDKLKYWVGVFGDKEEDVARLIVSNDDWKYIAERCIIDFKSAHDQPQLAWRWKSINCDRPGGIIVCAPGYDRSNPEDTCLAVHAQEDLVSFKEVIGTNPPPIVMAKTDQVEGSKRRKSQDEPVDFSKVPNRRTVKNWFAQLSWWVWFAATFPGLFMLYLVIYFRRVLGVPFKWVFANLWVGYGGKSRVPVAPAQPAVIPSTTPVLEPQTPVCPCPTDDERDQVDRSQDARLNRLEAQREADKQEIMAALNKLAERPVVEAQPVYRTTRKPAKR